MSKVIPFPKKISNSEALAAQLVIAVATGLVKEFAVVVVNENQDMTTYYTEGFVAGEAAFAALLLAQDALKFGTDQVDPVPLGG